MHSVSCNGVIHKEGRVCMHIERICDYIDQRIDVINAALDRGEWTDSMRVELSEIASFLHEMLKLMK